LTATTEVPVVPIPGYKITRERVDALDTIHRIAAEILIARGEFILVES